MIDDNDNGYCLSCEKPNVDFEDNIYTCPDGHYHDDAYQHGPDRR